MTTISTHPTGVRKAFGGRLVAFLGALLVSIGTMGGSVANATGTVSFTTPPDGSTAPAGTAVTPTGIASASGSTGGSGLDLVLVLDSSGSMTTYDSGAGMTRQAAQKLAAIALVNALPAATTSVSIVEFDSDANIVIGLTPLLPATNKTNIINAINGVDASGGTTIGTGIALGNSVLGGGDPTRSHQMVVLSDGSSSGDPAAAAAAAVGLTGNTDVVHSVGLPGHNVTTMQAIATAGGGVYTDGSNLAALTAIFDGTAGSLVGVDHIAVTLPDGTVIDPNSISGLGAFTVDSAYNINVGPNTWSVTAYFTDGSTATDTVTVIGQAPGVPLPAALPLMLGGFGVLGALRLRRRKG